MIDENNMWKIIDNLIDKNIKENESIKSMKMLDKIIITYAKISNHELHTSKIEFDMKLVRCVSIPTLKQVTLDVINHLRDNEGYP
jgi:hypothetical protein